MTSMRHNWISRVGFRRPIPEQYDLPVVRPLRAARWATTITWVAALAAVSVGVRYGIEGLYQSDDLFLVQVYGQDLVVAFLVLPVLAVSVWVAAHGSARGLVTWAGALIYLAYWYHYLLGAVNFGTVYLLHIVVVGSSLFALALLAASLDVERFAHRFGAHSHVRPIAGLLVGAGITFAAAAIVDIGRRLYDGEVLDSGIRGVYSVDLTVMLPTTVVAGVLLWRRSSWGFALAGPLLVNAALSVTTILTAVVVLVRQGIPVRGAAALLILPTAVLASLAALFLRRSRV